MPFLIYFIPLFIVVKASLTVYVSLNETLTELII